MRTLSAWESMELHALYNTNTELTPEGAEYTPITFKKDEGDTLLEIYPTLAEVRAKDFLGETIKETPVENQFDITEGDYWTPTETVYKHSLEELSSDILDKLYQDSPRERRWEHVHLVQQMLDNAKSPAHLGYIASVIYKAIDNSKITIQNEKTKEVNEIPTYFPKGHLKAFWHAYNLKKDKLSKASDSEVAEIESLLKDELTVQELKTLKKEIYKTKISFKTKKSLWALCDTRIAQIA